MELEPWEQLTDGFPDTPTGDVCRRIMEAARGDIEGVLEAYRIRGRWLDEHPDDWEVVRIGSVLYRLYDYRGGDPDRLAELIGEC